MFERWFSGWGFLLIDCFAFVVWDLVLGLVWGGCCLCLCLGFVDV